MKILLVEDDHMLATGLIEALRRESFAVDHVSLGRQVRSHVQTDGCDIVVLDLGLPDMDGLDVLRELRRSHADLPVLILTARSSLEDRVEGLNVGADDYLAKPFEIPELVARLRVMERRLGTAGSSELTHGCVRMDTTAQRVFVGEEEISLSRREYMLLKTLLENAGRVQTRERLESCLYGLGEEVASNAVEVHIHHLRRKLSSDLIHTIRGVGYTVKKV